MHMSITNPFSPTQYKSGNCRTVEAIIPMPTEQANWLGIYGVESRQVTTTYKPYFCT